MVTTAARAENVKKQIGSMLSGVRQATVCFQSSTVLENCLHMFISSYLRPCSIRDQMTIIFNLRVNQCISLDRLIVVTNNFQLSVTLPQYRFISPSCQRLMCWGAEGALLHILIKGSRLFRYSGSHHLLGPWHFTLVSPSPTGRQAKSEGVRSQIWK